MIERRKGLVAKQGDIRSVGGDMMALVAGLPKNGKGDDVNVNSPPPSLMLTLTCAHYFTSLLRYYLDVCVVFIREKTNGRVCP